MKAKTVKKNHFRNEYPKYRKYNNEVFDEIHKNLNIYEFEKKMHDIKAKRDFLPAYATNDNNFELEEVQKAVNEYDEFVRQKAKEIMMILKCSNKQNYQYSAFCNPFLNYIIYLLRIYRHILKDDYDKALYELWAFINLDFNTFIVPFIRDRCVELLNCICYNTHEIKKKCINMQNILKFIFSKHNSNVNDVILEDETLWSSECTFAFSDYTRMMETAKSFIFNNEHLEDTDNQKSMIDYLIYTIARDVQSHYNFLYFKSGISNTSGVNMFNFFPHSIIQLDENTGTVKNIPLESYSEKIIDLYQYPVLSIPDKKSSLSQAIASIARNGFNHFDDNNDVVLFEPLNVCVVKSGNHHINVALSLHRDSCMLSVKTVDLTSLFDYWTVSIRGGDFFWYPTNLSKEEAENSKVKVLDGRIALIFELAKLKLKICETNHNTVSSFKSPIRRPHISNCEIRDHLVECIFKENADKIISNYFLYGKLSEYTDNIKKNSPMFDVILNKIHIVREALSVARDKGYIKYALLLKYTDPESGRKEKLLYSMMDIIYFKWEHFEYSDPISVELVFVRTKRHGKSNGLLKDEIKKEIKSAVQKIFDENHICDYQKANAIVDLCMQEVNTKNDVFERLCTYEDEINSFVMQTIIDSWSALQ